MHLHILGICGTFMGSLALLARAAGHRVTGVDAQTYPPMSSLLARQGIELAEGYERPLPNPLPDLFLIGNALARGNPMVEEILRRGLPYASGPEWLGREILHGRWVLAVAGTHGKSSTSAMLLWILEQAGLEASFLIGAELINFGVSARLTDSPFFVLEADEYDTAFFDKRAKFLHYRPRTLLCNNLEYDHADIYPDLAAIETQFHHLLRTVPDNGLLLRPMADPALDRVWQRGTWTQSLFFGAGSPWQVRLAEPSGRNFSIWEGGHCHGEVHWQSLGDFNAQNALGAILAARHAGVPIATACQALGSFQGLRRRLELRGTVRDIHVYDDFAHHPTAIAKTIAALRSGMEGQGRILAVLEPRSNTMKMGVHRNSLAASLAGADGCFLYADPGLSWDPRQSLGGAVEIFSDVGELRKAVVRRARPGDRILIMSNGAFAGIHEDLLRDLAHDI